MNSIGAKRDTLQMSYEVLILLTLPGISRAQHKDHGPGASARDKSRQPNPRPPKDQHQCPHVTELKMLEASCVHPIF